MSARLLPVVEAGDENSRMPVALRSADYKPDLRYTRTVSSGAPGALRSEDFPAVEEFLHLLARAVRQFHTYPPTSPLCADAIASCHKAFTALERRERLVVRVTPTELIVDEIGVGAGTIVELELVRRLHRAHIASLDFDRSASIRDFSRFSADIISAETLTKTKTSLSEQLTEHGVETIVPHMAQRPEVLDVGVPAPSLCTLVDHERRRREADIEANTPINHLYPPDKGWVRLDPSAPFEVVSLTDLAVLVNDPGEVATILLRLTDDDGAATNGTTALEQKFTDVTTLFSSLDPRLARVMFGKLARAVLELEPDRRTALLQRTILPGLLDGRADGRVLRDFPDVDLAESLCLLLELETAAPEVLTAALNRLDLPAERRETVVPLIDEKLRARQSASARADDAGLDRHARRLIRVKDAPGKDFTEFAAFDLSMDEQVASALGGVCDSIRATDLPIAGLQCLRSLVRLEPNVGEVSVFLQKSLVVLGELEQAARWRDLAGQATGYRQLAGELRERRPDVADAIDHALAVFFSAERAATVATLFERDGAAQGSAGALIEAFGAAVVPACLGLLDDPARQSKNRSLATLLCAHAALIAPALAPELPHCGVAAKTVGVRVLGFAGAGYEMAVAEQIAQGDESLMREALRALARMGTAHAASIVAKQLQKGSVRGRAAAEEALWHFPPARAAALVRELLGSHDFVLQQPAIVTHLLDRAAKAGIDGLDPVLADLEPLRFRFWNPGLVRVALKARELRAR
jgi:hypothetical protein